MAFLLMVFFFSHLALGTFFTGSVPSMSPAPLSPRQESTEQVLASFAISGTCFSYFGNVDPALVQERTFGPCKTWCKRQKVRELQEQLGEDEEVNPDDVGDSHGCRSQFGTIEDVNVKSLIHYDEEDNPWVAGYCECNFELATIILDIVFEGLKQLENVFCAVALSAVQMIAEIGTAITPAGAVAAGARAAVIAAKTLAENGLGEHAFDNWVGLACALPDWESTSLFGMMVNSPSEDGESLGCMVAESKCEDVGSD